MSTTIVREPARFDSCAHRMRTFSTNIYISVQIQKSKYLFTRIKKIKNNISFALLGLEVYAQIKSHLLCAANTTDFAIFPEPRIWQPPKRANLLKIHDIYRRSSDPFIGEIEFVVHYSVDPLWRQCHHCASKPKQHRGQQMDATCVQRPVLTFRHVHGRLQFFVSNPWFAMIHNESDWCWKSTNSVWLVRLDMCEVVDECLQFVSLTVFIWVHLYTFFINTWVNFIKKNQVMMQ